MMNDDFTEYHACDSACSCPKAKAENLPACAQSDDESNVVALVTWNDHKKYVQMIEDDE
jgi:hypothetical protein